MPFLERCTTETRPRERRRPWRSGASAARRRCWRRSRTSLRGRCAGRSGTHSGRGEVPIRVVGTGDPVPVLRRRSAGFSTGAPVEGGDRRVAFPDAFSCQLRCRDATGETYDVAFSRESVRVTSYEDDAVLAVVETWADGVAALN
ncbi:MAG: hypothetical protein PWP08_979 [Methanofollis sp.]|nr:hypothetical protein [Methanofollis sp.]